jgi:hypothetical protein
MEGPGADSEEKHEPARDIDTAAVDSLKALDPERPIREATKPLRRAAARERRNGHRRVGGVYLIKVSKRAGCTPS